MNKLGFLAILLVPMMVMAGKLKVGDKFPDFNLKELGKPGKVAWSQYKGKVVIVDFWASWCEPCKKELPALNTLYKKYKGKGLVVIGVNVDNDEASALNFLKENKVDFPRAFDAGKKFASKAELATMPSSFVIDKKGVIKSVHSGYREGDVEEFEKEIKGLL